LQKCKNRNWINTTSQRSKGQDGRIGINMKVKKLQKTILILKAMLKKHVKYFTVFN